MTGFRFASMEIQSRIAEMLRKYDMHQLVSFLKESYGTAVMSALRGRAFEPVAYERTMFNLVVFFLKKKTIY